MKLFIVFLLCLFCLSGCGYSLQGSWKGGPGEQLKMEFRSDGSILSQGQKVGDLTWHGDYICSKVDTKKIRDAEPNFAITWGVDKKDISESSDTVEVRIHWVDSDHFDVGRTSFSRVKETK